ncbi:MAG: regulatory protein MerR [Actinomycetia bacterium]|nr:regulatory protein MerR [Actinomycetes bacterium]
MYTGAQTARLAGCTGSQLRYWSRTGLVVPTGDDNTYTFRDLVALRVVTSLLEAGLPLPRVRAALKHLTEAGEDITGLRIVTDGSTVWACRDDGQILDALRSGQLALFLAVDQFVESVESDVRAFDAERRAFVADLVARERSSAVHPSSPRPRLDP